MSSALKKAEQGKGVGSRVGCYFRSGSQRRPPQGGDISAESEDGLVDVWEKSIAGRRNSRRKGPGVGTHLSCSPSKKESSVDGAEESWDSGMIPFAFL